MRRNYRGIPINTSKNTHETVFDLIDKDLDAVVADIPCGSGAFLQRLKDNGYQNAKGIDIENILKIEHDDFVVGDMTKQLPLADHSLDVMVCIDGIEHISQQFDFVREVNRVLREKGTLIISTPNISSIRSRWKWLTTGHHHKCNSPLDEHNPSPLHHIAMISMPEIRYLLHTSGFKLTQITTNRIKPVSWLYLILVPFIYLWTFIAYRKTGKKENKAQVNKEVMQSMFTRSVLFGETLIVKAVKVTSIDG